MRPPPLLLISLVEEGRAEFILCDEDTSEVALPLFGCTAFVMGVRAGALCRSARPRGRWEWPLSTSEPALSRVC